MLERAFGFLGKRRGRFQRLDDGAFAPNAPRARLRRVHDADDFGSATIRASVDVDEHGVRFAPVDAGRGDVRARLVPQPQSTDVGVDVAIVHDDFCGIRNVHAWAFVVLHDAFAHHHVGLFHDDDAVFFVVLHRAAVHDDS